MEAKTNLSYLSLRRNLGILGIALPFVLLAGNNFNVEPSISLFYYTRMSVFFTGVLFAFGFFLFSYKGYEMEADEKISDNWVTNIAGMLALLTALIPTALDSTNICFPNGHSNPTISLIHLICAGGFLIIMGWMAIFKFTRGDQTIPLKKKRNLIYRVCGIGVWLSLLFLGFDIWFELEITEFDIYLGETLALIFFGSAWLTKSKALRGFGM